MDDEELVDPGHFKIILPDDDFDDDDEEDNAIARGLARKRNRVSRGSGIHGTT